jgi:hypothetical protein
MDKSTGSEMLIKAMKHTGTEYIGMSPDGVNWLYYRWTLQGLVPCVPPRKLTKVRPVRISKAAGEWMESKG